MSRDINFCGLSLSFTMSAVGKHPVSNHDISHPTLSDTGGEGEERITPFEQGNLFANVEHYTTPLRFTFDASVRTASKRRAERYILVRITLISANDLFQPTCRRAKVARYTRTLHTQMCCLWKATLLGSNVVYTMITILTPLSKRSGSRMLSFRICVSSEAR